MNANELLKVCRNLLCLLTLASVFSVSAQAGNAIRAVDTSVQAGVEVVRVQTETPLAAPPEGFVVQAPARIAFDFVDTTSQVPRQAMDGGRGNVRSVNVVQAGNRSRLILNLQQATGYETKIEGNSLLVFLKPVQSDRVSRSSDVKNEEVSAPVTTLVKDIDFRKSDGPAGKLMVMLANSQAGVDIRQQGQSLVVEFAGASLPEGLRRRLDVSDFGTPVQTILAAQVGNKVRLIVTPKGNWEHSAYQSDNQFVLEVRELKVDPSKLTQGPGYSGEKLSLNFQNIEVRSLLQVIADFTSFNIVTSESVSGSLTLRLKDVPWDQALDIILQSKGLGMRKTGNVILVAPQDELSAREKQQLESKVNVENLEPLKTQVFQLKFAKAPDIMLRMTNPVGNAGQTANGQNQRVQSGMLSARGNVSADPRTNQLFVTDIPSRLRDIEALLARIDVAVRQVVIEARIVEASDSFGKSIGVRLGGADLRGVRGGDAGYSVGGSSRVAVGGSYDAVANSTGYFGASESGAMSNFVNLPAKSVAGSIALTLFNASANRLLNLEIQAMESEQKGTIVSSPRLLTADQVKAVIEQGKQVTYPTGTDDKGKQTYATANAALKLDVTPQITPDGQIILDLDVTKNSIDSITGPLLSINTKMIKTQAIVENGGTVMLGGIFESQETRADDKVPLLGDIPYVGNLFKSKSTDIKKTEMLIFITPRIVIDGNIGN